MNDIFFHHLRFMNAAIRLSRKNLCRTKNNPSVGALIVRHDNNGFRIVGRGTTGYYGKPHAEIIALEEARELSRGSTLYVTLEPCCHYGMTGPCTIALINSGIKCVVIAVQDPDHRVNGRGIKSLKDSGIQVIENVLTEIAEDELSSYLHYKKFHKPEITLKLAISSDGFIGKKNQGNIKISNEISRMQSHILRTQNNAILVGINTIILDNPKLNCRLPELEKNSPIRIILDSELRIPIFSNIVNTAKDIPTWIFCSKNCDAKKIDKLISIGCYIFPLSLTDNKINLEDLLKILFQKKISSLLVEGGTKIIESFWNFSLCDRLILFHSPLIIGNEGYRSPSFQKNIFNYKKIRSERFGEDLCIHWKKIV